LFIEQDGVKTLLVDVVADLGIDRAAVYQRLRKGWSLEDALTVPVREYKRHP
jgi:hypothetical protein